MDTIVELSLLADRYGSAALRALAAELRRKATALVFRDAGIAAGRRQFEVGEAGGKLVTVTPAGEGVGWWHQAVKNLPTRVAITGRSVDATRMMLGRGLDEIDQACPALGAELRRNGRRTTGAAVYLPAINSPSILTE